MPPPPPKDRREKVLDEIFAAAKHLHAQTAREAAEMSKGRALTDDEWAAYGGPWEARWDEWEVSPGQ
jgi:hypothetical protein